MTHAPFTPAARSAPRISAWLLASAGTLPFFAALADLLFLGKGVIAPVQIYAAVIASFVCGIHWGAALRATEGFAVRLLLLSNAVALLAWLAALLPPQPGFLLLAALFAALTLVDRHLSDVGLSPPWFWPLRLTISAVVVGLCAAIGLVA